METPECKIDYKARKWYNRYDFPLIPLLVIRPKNEYNTKSISFNWLFLKVWTLDAFEFELAFNVDTHWGIGLTAILPYLRVVVCIPLPQRFGMWVQRNLWRKPDPKVNI